MDAKIAAKAQMKNAKAYANACARRNAMVAEGTPVADANAVATVWFRAIVAGIYVAK